MNIFSEKIPTKKQEEIKDYVLKHFDAIASEKDYAFWQIKHADFTAIFYNSSKFVIQGKNIDSLINVLAEQFVEFQNFSGNVSNGGNAKKEISVDIETETEFSTHIGTDESGKGDFFGPLVIAGVQVTEKNRQLFIDLGIKDSKTLKDEAMLKMALQIQKNSVYSVIAISNSKYNELYQKFRNLNKLLAWGHARVIENILEKSPCQWALSDKFGDESLIQNALLNKGQSIRLEQRVRAESDIAVAAASVLARATFVQKMKQMENYYGCKFPKGANKIVKTCASDFISKYGKERLIEVCKAHFKTFNEV